MKNQKIITGIDIGTTKIAVIIVEQKEDLLNIIGFGTSNSNGLSKGIVVDIEQTINSIDKENTPEVISSRVFRCVRIFELLCGLDVIEVGPTSRNVAREYVIGYHFWVVGHLDGEPIQRNTGIETESHFTHLLKCCVLV